MFLFGAALALRATGTISIEEMRGWAACWASARAGGLRADRWSLFFKVSVFPFHFWVPASSQGAPTPSPAFMRLRHQGRGLRLLLTLMGQNGSTASGAPRVAAWIVAGSRC